MEALNPTHNVRCQAFARCENAAEGACAHPVLGAYLSCARCATKLENTLHPCRVAHIPEGLAITCNAVEPFVFTVLT